MAHSKHKSHKITLITVALTFLATCYMAAEYPTMPHKVCHGMSETYNVVSGAIKTASAESNDK